MIKNRLELQNKLEKEGMDLQELKKAYSELEFECYRKRWKSNAEKIEMYKTLEMLKIEIEVIECY